MKRAALQAAFFLHQACETFSLSAYFIILTQEE